MIFGVDTSRYQTLGSYDRQGFEVVNVEDPQLGAKVAACIAAGVPWGAYLWVYPGHDLTADTNGAIATVRGLGHGEPPLGLWFDYEQDGVQPGQLVQAFAAADAAGMASGYYSGPSMLDHSPFLNRRWWNAAYPGANDGSYPGVDALWASSKPRPMTLWQYTSGGGIDRNVVIDEEWFAHLGSTPAPLEEDDMKITYIVSPSQPNHPWAFDGMNRRLVLADEWGAIMFNTAGQPNGAGNPVVIEVSNQWFDSVPDVTAVPQRVNEAWGELKGYEYPVGNKVPSLFDRVAVLLGKTPAP